MAENKSTRGLIVIGYPGIGKTTLANSSTNGMGSRSDELIDLESSIFNVDGERDENWYVVYCRLAISFARQGYTVLASSHQEVVNEFKRYEPSDEYSIFVVVPHKDLKDEWTKKLLERYESNNSQKNENALKRAQDFFVSDIELLSMQPYFSVIFIESMNYNLDSMIDCMQYLVDMVSQMDCLSCPEFIVLDRTNKLYQDNSPSIIAGDITCTHHSICPNMIGKEKIFEILDRIE